MNYSHKEIAKSFADGNFELTDLPKCQKFID